jgi:hypothetical protein
MRILGPTQYILSQHDCLEFGNLSFQTRLMPNCPHTVRSMKGTVTMAESLVNLVYVTPHNTEAFHHYPCS